MNTKLNYSVNIPKKEEIKVNKSINALSKQAVINQSLAYRMPQSVPINNGTEMVKNNGFGRTI